jgi:osmotically-inducible protein OsmY
MNGRALAVALSLLLLVSGAAAGRRLSESGRGHAPAPDVVSRVSDARDEALRRLVARAIYGHPTFWRYASFPAPPIQITVEDGRVTLTGVVGSEIERALAGTLATGHGEVSVTNLLGTRLARIN